MNRREWLILGAGTLAARRLLGATPGAAAAEPDPGPPGAGRPLWIDGCGEAFDVGDALPLPADALQALSRCGLSATNFTIVGPGSDFEKAVRAVAFVSAAA